MTSCSRYRHSDCLEHLIFLLLSTPEHWKLLYFDRHFDQSSLRQSIRSITVHILTRKSKLNLNVSVCPWEIEYIVIPWVNQRRIIAKRVKPFELFTLSSMYAFTFSVPRIRLECIVMYTLTLEYEITSISLLVLELFSNAVNIN